MQPAGGAPDGEVEDYEVMIEGLDLTLTKNDGDVTAIPDDTIAYTLDYANAGSADATGVVITETVPAGTTFDAGESTAGWIAAGGGSTRLPSRHSAAARTDRWRLP